MDFITSFLVQPVHSVGKKGIWFRGWMEGIVILASCEHHFMKVNESLVKQPSNNIYISVTKMILSVLIRAVSFLILKPPTTGIRHSRNKKDL